MQKLISENRWEDARKIQDDVNEVIEALTKVGVFKGVKAALKLQGIDCGECRRPFASLDKEQIKYLQDITGEK